MIDHLLNNTAAVYRSTPSGTYPFDETWATDHSIPVRLTSDVRKVVADDGSEFLTETLTALCKPTADVVELDRLYIDGVIYEVKSVSDVDGMGRETYLTLEAMPEGTPGEMGIV